MNQNSNKVKKVVLVFLCMTAMLLIFAACGGSSLVGQWVAVEEGGHPVPDDEMFGFDLSRNGTGIVREEWRGEVWEDEVTWSSDNGVLTLTDDRGPISWAYRISGRRLYLYDVDGSVDAIFVRQ